VTRLALLLCVVLAASGDARAAANDPPWVAKLEAWLAAVEAHAPGVRDAAAEQIGAWKNADLDAVTPYLDILTELLPDPGKTNVAIRRGMKETELVPLRALARREAARGDVNRVMKRGALLHADIMMSGAAREYQRISAAEAQREARTSGRVIVLGLDGHHEGYAVVPRHWAFARRLLDTVHPDPASDDFVRVWYRATTAFLLHRSHWGEAERQLQHERQRLTPNARAHLDSGSVFEGYAHPRVQSIVTASTDRGMRYDVQSVAYNLQQAHMHFSQAVALDPQLVEARVRLARVRTLLGNADAAVPELRAASSAATDPPVRYYAALFLGDAEQALGRYDAAKAAYEHAAALYPASQAPHLGLSLLAREGGDREQAQAALRKFLDVPAQRRSGSDPWWIYFMGSGRVVHDLALGMWKAVPGKSQ
jgi:hypothetical protein